MEEVVSKKHRIMSFDLLKLFAMYLVIWGHCIMWLLSSESSDNMVFRILNAFHVSLFMMISGYFAVSSIKLPPIKFFNKKFRQLIYPCFVWGLLILLFVYYLLYRNSSCLDDINGFSIKQLLVDLYWYSDFWFLKSCFICYCLLYLGSHLGLKTIYWILLTLLVSQFISPFFVSFMYPSFILGYVMKEFQSYRLFIKQKALLIFSIFIFMLFFWDKAAWENSHGISLEVFYSGFPNILSVAFSRLYRLVLGIFGALSFFSLAMYIPNERMQSKFLCRVVYWGGYTLEIYILQSVILEKTISHYFKFDDMNIQLFNYFVSPLIAVVILLACIIIVRLLLKSNSLMTILFGR